MMPMHHDATEPTFARKIHKRIAIAFMDECKQLHDQAENDYVTAANTRATPENDARYELSKRHMQVTRGMLAEATDIANTYPATVTDILK